MKRNAIITVVLVAIVILIIGILSLQLGQNRIRNDTQTEITTSITKSAALQKIQNLPEVIEYIQLLAKQNQKAELEVEDWDEDWGVHVFEIVKEDDSTTHTATFGWYQVNKTTGNIVKN